jgi:VCBS repeat-containing protein
MADFTFTDTAANDTPANNTSFAQVTGTLLGSPPFLPATGGAGAGATFMRFFQISIGGVLVNVGTLVVTKATGAYTLNPTNNGNRVEELTAADGTLTSSLSYTANGVTRTLTLDVVGADDPGRISAIVNNGAVVEDASGDDSLTASGAVTVLDRDFGASQDALQVGSVTDTYGTFATTATGWTYTLDNSSLDVQALGAGDTVVQLKTLTTADGTTPANGVVTITITGTNDEATITATATGDVEEDGTATATGVITVLDVDTGENHAFNEVIVGAFGTLTVTNGAWSYALNNSDPLVQGLGAGVTTIDSFTVTSEDGTATAPVDITITGADDPSSITATANGAVTEDGTLSATGTISVTDADNGEDHALNESLVGTYGTLTVTNGAWSYALNNASPLVQNLGDGATVTDAFAVRSEDGNSSAPVTITITGTNDAPVITSGPQSAMLTESDAALTASGQVTASDIDTGDMLSYAAGTNMIVATGLTLSGAQTAALQAAFSVTAAGAWTFNTPSPDYLAVGDSVTASFVVIASDGHSGTASQTVTITITGTNDAPIVSNAVYPVAEDTGVQVTSLTPTANDVDSGAVLTYSQVGSVPGVIIAANGDFSIDTNNAAYQSVAQGEVRDVVVNFRVTDDQNESVDRIVTVQVTGANDAPVAADASRTATEDGALVTGQLVATDVDTGDTRSFALDAPVAGLTVTSTGGYSFDPSNAAYQSLAVGAILTVTANFTVTDNNLATDGGVLTITLTGTNDAPVITSNDQGASLIETNANLFANGQVTASDVDNGDTLVFSRGDSTLSSNRENLTEDQMNSLLNGFFLEENNVPVDQAAPKGSTANSDPGAPDGSWTYSISSPDFLNDGDSVTLTFTVNVSDGHDGFTSQDVTITITGSDEIFVGDAGDNTFFGTQFDDQFFGNGGIDTIDFSETVGPIEVVNEGDETPGTIDSLNSGHDTFTGIENFILTSGDDTFTGNDSDETVDGGNGNDDIETNGGDDIVLAGAGDDLVHGGSGEGDDYYDGGAGTGDTLTYSSTTLGVVVDMNAIDRSGNATVAAILAGVPLPSNTQVGLATGAEIGTDAFRNFENVTGGSGNDSLTGNSGANTLDGGDGDDFLDGRGGADTLDGGDGDDLLEGGSGADTLIGGAGIDTITYANQTGAVQVNLLTGNVNAGAQGGNDTVTGVENAILTGADDQFIGSSGDNQVTGGLGDDQLNGGLGDDTAIYTNSTAVDGLAVEVQAGPFHALVLGATSGDGQDTITNIEHLVFTNGPGAADDVIIDIVNSNAVVATVGDVNGVLESSLTAHTSATGNVLTNDINLDADAGDVKVIVSFSAGATSDGTTAAFGTTLQGQYGTLTLNSNGTYSYVADFSTNALQAGEMVHDIFRYQADDGDDGTSRLANLDITITGTNDLPVLGGDVARTLIEDAMLDEGSLVATGTLTAVDPDRAESGFRPAVIEGEAGTFTLLANGSWSYSALNSATVVQQIGMGDSLTETFTALSIDGTPIDVVVTINGVNDNPVAEGVAFDEGSLSTLEETNLTLTTAGSVDFSDVDTNDSPQAAYVNDGTSLSTDLTSSLSLSEGQLSALAAAFLVAPDGTFTFSLGSPNYLGANDVLVLTYTVDITDDHGGSTTQDVVITINGNNDNPVITSAAQTATLDESAEPAQLALSASGAVTATDVDNGDVLTFSVDGSNVSVTGTTLTLAQTSTLRAGFTLNEDGTWDYNIASPDFLGDDDVVTLTYSIDVNDDNGGVTSQDVVITINGTNDAPDILAAVDPVDGPGVLTNPSTTGNDSFAHATDLSNLFSLDANPNIANATTIPHVTISGTGGGHADYYTFAIGAGGGSLFLDVDGAGFDTTVALFRIDGLGIAGNDDSSLDSGSFSGLDSRLGVNLLDAGVYIVIIDTFVGIGNGADPSSIANGLPYTLHVSVVNPGIVQGYSPVLTETNADLSTSGQVIFTDVDNDDTPEASYTAATDASVTATGITLTSDQINEIKAGFTLTTNAGNFTYSLASPDYLALGDVVTAVFNVHVIDDLGVDTVQPITITIIGTNDAPVLNDFTASLNDTANYDHLSIPSSAGLTIANLATDVDTGDMRTFALVSVLEEGDGGELATTNLDGSTTIETDYGTVTVARVGTVSFVANDAAINALNEEQVVTRTFTVRVTDNNGASDTATFTININGANDNPIVPTPLLFDAHDDNDGSITLNLLTGEAGPLDDAFDPDSGGTVQVNAAVPLTVLVASTALTAAENLIITNTLRAILPNTLVGGGGYTFNTALFDTLDLTETATITFTYAVIDGDGLSVPRTATVTINGALEVITLTEFDDGPINGGNFGDLIDGLDGDDVINGGSGNDHLLGNTGDDTLSGGSGNDELEGNDGDDIISGGSGNDLISGGDGNNILNGGSGNDRIIAGSGSNTVDGGSGNDTLVLEDNLASYFPPIVAGGTTTYTHRTSGEIITVRNVEHVVGNAAPVIVNGLGGIFETPDGAGFEPHSLFSLVPFASDLEGDALTFEIVGGNDAGFFSVGELGQLIQIARIDFETNPHSIPLTIKVSDSHGGSSTAIITVLISDVNDPIGQISFGETSEIPENSANGTEVATAHAVDPDAGDVVTYSFSEGDAGGRFAINATTGAITVANGALLDFEEQTSYSLDVVATSSGGGSSIATVIVNLSNVLDPIGPVAVTELTSITEGTASGVIGTASVDFEAGTIVAYSLSDSNGGRFAIDATTGAISVVNGLWIDFENAPSHTITILATGTNNGSSSSTTATVTVNDVASETLVGSAGFDQIFGGDNVDVFNGGDGDDSLDGGGGDDTITGGAGDDDLYGGTGTNTLIGGTGNDRYNISSTTDTITEVAGGGFDVVLASVDVTLSATTEVELIVLTGSAANATGSDTANTIIGNGLANILTGGGGDDTLIGGAGDDQLFGGLGADTLYGGTGANILSGGAGDDGYYDVDSGDQIIETSGGGYDIAFTIGDFALSANAEVELLIMGGTAVSTTGSSTGNYIIGNASDNIIRGLGGDDILSGNGGNDILDGGTGADMLIGGAGADQFRISSTDGADTIADFTSGQDKIALDSGLFSSTGVLALVQGAGAQFATTANSAFLYNSTTGALSYDADGNGAGAAVEIANLGAGTTVALGDFMFY